VAELDELTRWLAERAADAPRNFLHLVRLLEAERAWAAGDFRAAAQAFDAARREAGQRQRPWHRALIAEHAARFYLAHGLEQAGHDLLAQARQEYLAWGATAKVSQLDWAYPALRAPAEAIADGQPADSPQDRAAITTGTIDLLGIVSASQALSSETSIGRLHARVAEVLSAMTGATGVHLPLCREESGGWLLPAPDADRGTVPVSGQDRAVPMSVLRYVQRTGEPLVVADAVRDDRFARDPYFADVTCCSLLAVPVVSRGALRAVLLLENRLLGGAFTASRLDAVKLVAGQLAVSLDNARARADLRGFAAEQAALRRVATLVARPAPPEEVFAAVTEEAGRLFTADVAVMNRYAPDGTGAVVGAWASTGAAPVAVGDRVPLGGRNVTSLVFETKRFVRVDGYTGASGPIGEIAADAGLRALVGVPISVGGDLWGVMIAATRAEPLPADTESRLAGFTELAGTAIANAQARAEVAASRARIVAAADETRRRIERDLHDGVQQRLVTQALMLSGVRDRVPADLRADLDEVRDELAAARQELRDLCWGVHPTILVEAGLGAAIRALARRSPLPVRVQLRADGRLTGPCEITAYYVAAEAFTNAAKHARASAVDILIEEAYGTLTVQVSDDGAGGADASRGSGLTGLRDRVEAVGGSMTLDSTAGAGTVLTVRLPVAAGER
jgi:signal transduction histidine kinase